MSLDNSLDWELYAASCVTDENTEFFCVARLFWRDKR